MTSRGEAWVVAGVGQEVGTFMVLAFSGVFTVVTVGNAEVAAV